jgi:ERCC4-type nuclease
MATSVLVDTNAGENALFATLVCDLGKDLVTRKRLDLGDVEVRGEIGRILWERKSWNDLVSSLRDGRYLSQKARLLAERERAAAEGTRLRVVYLIETARVPAYDDKTHGMPNSQPFAAMTKMALRDGITLMFCASSEDAAKMIAYAVRAADKGGLDGAAHAAEVAASGYAGTVKFSNKRKNADENMFEIMLASLTGVSGKKASAIAEAYASPAALVRAYEALKASGANGKKLDTMLADVPVNDKRLGPALSAKLRQAFFPGAA